MNIWHFALESEAQTSSPSPKCRVRVIVNCDSSPSPSPCHQKCDSTSHWFHATVMGWFEKLNVYFMLCSAMLYQQTKVSTTIVLNVCFSHHSNWLATDWPFFLDGLWMFSERFVKFRIYSALFASSFWLSTEQGSATVLPWWSLCACHLWDSTWRQMPHQSLRRLQSQILWWKQ